MLIKYLIVRVRSLALFFNDRPAMLLCFTIVSTISITQNIFFDRLISNNFSISLLFFIPLVLSLVLVTIFYVSSGCSMGVQSFCTTVKISLLVASVCFLSLALCYSNLIKSARKVQGFTGQRVNIEGVVIDQRGEREYVFAPYERNFGIVYLKFSTFAVFQIGDQCTFTGNIVEPKSTKNFDYKKYLIKRRVFAFLEVNDYICKKGGNKLLGIRANIEKRISSSMPEPEASLLIGILFGSNRVFSEKFEESIKKSGLSHIISASGYNVALILSFADKVLYKSGGRNSIILKIILVWVFCIFAGFSSSLVRASTMSTITLTSLFFGRHISKFYSLLLCCTSIIVINPLIIYDIGFLLSVFSTMGLIVFPNCFSKLNKGLKDILLPTISCFLFTLPLSILFFKKISLVSVLSNLAVGPIIEGTIYWGLLSVFLSYIFPNISLIYIIPYLQLNIFKKIINLSSIFPELSIENNSYLYCAILVFLISIFCLWFYQISDRNYYLKQSRRSIYGSI